MLERNAFQNIGHVFAHVCGAFHVLVYLPPLNYIGNVGVFK